MKNTNIEELKKKALKNFEDHCTSLGLEYKEIDDTYKDLIEKNPYLLKKLEQNNSYNALIELTVFSIDCCMKLSKLITALKEHNNKYRTNNCEYLYLEALLKKTELRLSHDLLTCNDIKTYEVDLIDNLYDAQRLIQLLTLDRNHIDSFYDTDFLAITNDIITSIPMEKKNHLSLFECRAQLEKKSSANRPALEALQNVLYSFVSTQFKIIAYTTNVDSLIRVSEKHNVRHHYTELFRTLSSHISSKNIRQLNHHSHMALLGGLSLLVSYPMFENPNFLYFWTQAKQTNEKNYFIPIAECVYNKTEDEKPAILALKDHVCTLIEESKNFTNEQKYKLIHTLCLTFPDISTSDDTFDIFHTSNAYYNSAWWAFLSNRLIKQGPKKQRRSFLNQALQHAYDFYTLGTNNTKPDVNRPSYWNTRPRVFEDFAKNLLKNLSKNAEKCIDDNMIDRIPPYPLDIDGLKTNQEKPPEQINLEHGYSICFRKEIGEPTESEISTDKTTLRQNIEIIMDSDTPSIKSLEEKNTLIYTLSLSHNTINYENNYLKNSIIHPIRTQLLTNVYMATFDPLHSAELNKSNTLAIRSDEMNIKSVETYRLTYTPCELKRNLYYEDFYPYCSTSDESQSNILMKEARMRNPASSHDTREHYKLMSTRTKKFMPTRSKNLIQMFFGENNCKGWGLQQEIISWANFVDTSSTSAIDNKDAIETIRGHRDVILKMINNIEGVTDVKTTNNTTMGKVTSEVQHDNSKNKKLNEKLLTIAKKYHDFEEKDKAEHAAVSNIDNNRKVYGGIYTEILIHFPLTQFQPEAAKSCAKDKVTSSNGLKNFEKMIEQLRKVDYLNKLKENISYLQSNQEQNNDKNLECAQNFTILRLFAAFLDNRAQAVLNLYAKNAYSLSYNKHCLFNTDEKDHTLDNFTTEVIYHGMIFFNLLVCKNKYNTLFEDSPSEVKQELITGDTNLRIRLAPEDSIEGITDVKTTDDTTSIGVVTSVIDPSNPNDKIIKVSVKIPQDSYFYIDESEKCIKVKIGYDETTHKENAILTHKRSITHKVACPFFQYDFCRDASEIKALLSTLTLLATAAEGVSQIHPGWHSRFFDLLSINTESIEAICFSGDPSPFTDHLSDFKAFHREHYQDGKHADRNKLLTYFLRHIQATIGAVPAADLLMNHHVKATSPSP